MKDIITNTGEIFTDPLGGIDNETTPTTTTKVDAIRVKTSTINLKVVRRLAESIKSDGLINPITINEDHELIAGAHRLEAVKRLGWEDVAVTIVDKSGLEAEAVGIAENIYRNCYHFTEKGAMLRRLKGIHETLHPETRAGVAGGRARQNSASDKLSFAKDAADKTGESPRSIERLIQMDKNLTPEAKEAIREFGIPQNQALELARKTPETQNAAVSRMKIFGENGVKVALSTVEKTEHRETGETQGEKDPCIVIHHPGEDFQEMVKRDVKPVPDSIMFLWATYEFIWDSKKLLDKWGYEYRTIVIWDKEGTGRFPRNRCEFCLVGTKGNPALNHNPCNLPDIIREPENEQGEKPKAFRDLVKGICREAI